MFENSKYSWHKVKKVKWFCIAPSRETSKALRHGSHSVTRNYTDASLYLVSIHQMAPPQTEVANIKLQHLSTPKGWKAESAWLADLQRTVYPRKWSPVSCRSSAVQRKFAGHWPTFYHCTTQPTHKDQAYYKLSIIPAFVIAKWCQHLHFWGHASDTVISITTVNYMY